MWLDAEAFPKHVCKNIHTNLTLYVEEVLKTDWDHLAKYGLSSKEAAQNFHNIWKPYYQFEPATEAEKAFYIGSIDQLNNLGVARQEKILYASGEVQPKVKLILICGGILMVEFLLFLSCPSRNVQLVITSLIAALISSSIYLVLSLQNPMLEKSVSSLRHL